MGWSQEWSQGCFESRGFEPATPWPEGTFEPSREGAGCGLTGCLAAPILAGRGLASLSICHRWLPSWLPAIRQTSTGYAEVRAHVEWRLSFAGQLRHWQPSSRLSATQGRNRAPRGELAAFTARHDEVTPGAGPLRAIPVRPQVALPTLRALLAARPLTKTHRYTVARHRAGFTMPRRWPPLSAYSQQPRGPVRYCRCGCGGLRGHNGDEFRYAARSVFHEPALDS